MAPFVSQPKPVSDIAPARPVMRPYSIREEKAPTPAWPPRMVDRPPVPPPRPFRHGIIAFAILVIVFVAFLLTRQALMMKDDIMTRGESGYDALTLAGNALRAKDYPNALAQFDTASRAFAEANTYLDFPGAGLIDTLRYIPGLSQVASGKLVLEAGAHFADAGTPIALLVEQLVSSREAYASGEKVSLISLFHQAKDPLVSARLSLEEATAKLALVNIGDIPEDKQSKFLTVRETLPVLTDILRGFEKNDTLIEELLGGNGPRTYLFLLQNNHELRATGGFIGSYALIDVNQGVIRRFFVDGIFNPDGQLKENIVPPKPIQKISAGWSLHDSNWSPDFPTAAEKAIFFYEKTGGPTVDGVITLTPTVMQKLLAVIGPIELPQYGVTVDADNFIPVIQEQVEVKYDKELNEPKKILVDLSRELISRVFALQDRATSRRIAEALMAGLNEKHILMYMRHEPTQHLIDEVGWSGRVLSTSKDYLSVIHSNINGYKTDGVIDETIRHRAEIASDGSVTDTVTITRTHRGGDTPYEWWNRVNADYLRVYVPKGSELLSTSGTTREFPPEPLDYDRLGFRRDADVVREETGQRIDEKSGVRISEDAGKTVFGAWVYVSPKESVTVEYRYRLPFSIDMTALATGDPQSYSVLYQKQSGSPGSTLLSALSVPENVPLIWQTEPNLVPYGREWRRESTLTTDVFQGVVFGQK